MPETDQPMPLTQKAVGIGNEEDDETLKIAVSPREWSAGDHKGPHPITSSREWSAGGPLWSPVNARPVRHRRVTLLPIDDRPGQSVQDQHENEIAQRVQPRRSRRFPRIVIAVLLLALLFGSGGLAYAQLNQARTSIYEVNIQTGATAWQQQVTSSMQDVGVDEQGSLFDMVVGQRHQLVALDARGTLQWKSFTSASHFFLSAVTTAPGTLLVALTDERPSVNSQNATATHFLSCYLLRRSTGQIIWQWRSGFEQGKQKATFLGADGGLIYIGITALVPTRGNVIQIRSNEVHKVTQSPTGDHKGLHPTASLPPPLLYRDGWSPVYSRGGGRDAVGWRPLWSPVLHSLEDGVAWGPLRSPVRGSTTTSSNKTITGNELLALDAVSGKTVWHIFSVPTPERQVQDSGKLLVAQQLLFWQVIGKVYALNAASGRVLWQRLLPEDNVQVLLQEEGQMVETAGSLVVERSDIYHALDVATGKERWVLSNPGINAAAEQAAGGLATGGNTLLIYGNGQIQDFDATTQQIRWSQKQLDAVLNVTISTDGTLVYATVMDSIEGGSPTQALVALDLRNGAVRWTFQPSEQAGFVHLGAEGILLRHSRLLTETCLSTPGQGCTTMALYVLRTDNGQVAWKYEGKTLSDVYYSVDGNRLVFQSERSAWSDLMAHFRN